MKASAPPAFVSILLVDDHAVVRMGLTSALNRETDMKVVGEAPNARFAVERFRQHQPDLVILDSRLPDLPGSDTARLLREESPGVKILMHSAYEGEEEIYRAFEAGVNGYVIKTGEVEEVVQAVRAIVGGDRYFSRTVSDKLAARVHRGGLTAREHQVLAELAKGLSNKEIACALNSTERSVKFHVLNLLAKLGAKDRTHAISLAIQRGIIRLE